MTDTIQLHVLADDHGKFPKKIRVPVIVNGFTLITGRKWLQVKASCFEKRIRTTLQNSCGYFLLPYKPVQRGTPRIYNIRVDGRECYKVQIFSMPNRDNGQVTNTIPRINISARCGPPLQLTAVSLPIVISSSADAMKVKVTAIGTGYHHSDEKWIPIVNGVGSPTFMFPGLVARRVYQVTIEAGGEVLRHSLRVR